MKKTSMLYMARLVYDFDRLRNASLLFLGWMMMILFYVWLVRALGT